MYGLRYIRCYLMRNFLLIILFFGIWMMLFYIFFEYLGCMVWEGLELNVFVVSVRLMDLILVGDKVFRFCLLDFYEWMYCFCICLNFVFFEVL